MGLDALLMEFKALKAAQSSAAADAAALRQQHDAAAAELAAQRRSWQDTTAAHAAESAALRARADAADAAIASLREEVNGLRWAVGSQGDGGAAILGPPTRDWASHPMARLPCDLLSHIMASLGPDAKRRLRAGAVCATWLEACRAPGLGSVYRFGSYAIIPDTASPHEDLASLAVWSHRTTTTPGRPPLAAAATSTGVVTIVDLSTGRRLRRLHVTEETEAADTQSPVGGAPGDGGEEPPPPCYDVALTFSADGGRLLTVHEHGNGHESVARVWGLDDGGCRLLLPLAGGNCAAVFAGAESSLVVTGHTNWGGGSTVIAWWCGATGACIAESTHDGRLVAIVATPSGGRVAVAFPRLVIVMDVASHPAAAPTSVARLSFGGPEDGCFSCVALSPDGARLVSLSAYSTEGAMWDVGKGTHARFDWEQPLESRDGDVAASAVAWTGNGRHVIIGDEGEERRITFLDAATLVAESATRLEWSHPLAFAATADGHAIVVIHDDKSIEVYQSALMLAGLEGLDSDDDAGDEEDEEDEDG